MVGGNTDFSLFPQNFKFSFHPKLGRIRGNALYLMNFLLKLPKYSYIYI